MGSLDASASCLVSAQGRIMGTHRDSAGRPSYTQGVAPKVDTADLLSDSEVAEQLGLAQYNSVTTDMHRHDGFFRPVVCKSRGHTRLWLRSDVLSWKTRRQTRAGD